MISRIRGKLVKKEESRIIIEVGGIFYEVNIPLSVSIRLDKDKKEEDNFVELVIYHYFNLGKNRGIPVMIGFIDELERDFFQMFIGVSGIGPKVALRAFDKPISLIAQGIEEGNLDFLKTLAGIGKQKAKQIIAQLQGKVGRFTLIKDESFKKERVKEEIIEEAKQILRRLEYGAREIEEMIRKVIMVKPGVDNVEDLLNEIYRQRK